MADAPWLFVIGMGEDGPDGLSAASRAALEAAEVVMGPARHLDLATGVEAERVVWPVPFEDGWPLLEGFRGRAVAVLASGDPFWFGAGAGIAERFGAEEWRAYPAPSTFALAAARLGWRVEGAVCLGLHAAPAARLRPHLTRGARVIALMRDGAALAAAVEYLNAQGMGASRCWALEALGGPRERVRGFRAEEGAPGDAAHPVALAIEVAGALGLPGPAALTDDLFDHDGQLTKRPMRALTLSALAPRPGERLWDIGLGAASISAAWLMSGAGMSAVGFEADPERARRAAANIARLGLAGFDLVEGRAPEALTGPAPDAVFIGGGLSEALLEALWDRLPPGVRVVANAVTLESQALLTDWQGRAAGSLLKVDLAESRPVGTRRGWRAAMPVIQWSVER